MNSEQKNEICFFCYKDLGYKVKEIEILDKNKTNEETVNKAFLICKECLMGEAPATEEYYEALRIAWKGGVFVREVEGVNGNFLRVLKMMVDSREMFLAARDCDEHKRRELILFDKDKDYCLELTTDDMVKYSTNENIKKEIERRKEKGIWVEWHDSTGSSKDKL